MIKRTITALIVSGAIGCLGLLSCSSREKVPEAIPFHYKMDEAFKAAAEKSQPLIVVIFKTGCPYSKMLDDSTFSSRIVISMSTDMEFARIDAAEDTLAARQLGVSFYPTIIVFQPSGEEVDRLVGYYPPADFFNEIQLYLQGNETLKDYHIRLSDEPNRVDYHLILGEKYRHRSDWDKAMEYYNNVLNMAEDSAGYEVEKAMIGIADVFCEQGKFQEAALSYTEFIARFPGSEDTEDAIRKLAYCLARDGRLDEARAQFRLYLDEYPNGLYHEWAEEKLKELNKFSNTGS